MYIDLEYMYIRRSVLHTHEIVCLVFVHAIAATPQMKDAIEKELKAANLQNIDITVTKIIQLYETKNSRCVINIYVCTYTNIVQWTNMYTICSTYIHACMCGILY